MARAALALAREKWRCRATHLPGGICCRRVSFSSAPGTFNTARKCTRQRVHLLPDLCATRIKKIFFFFSYTWALFFFQNSALFSSASFRLNSEFLNFFSLIKSCLSFFFQINSSSFSLISELKTTKRAVTWKPYPAAESREWIREKEIQNKKYKTITVTRWKVLRKVAEKVKYQKKKTSCVTRPCKQLKVFVRADDILLYNNARLIRQRVRLSKWAQHSIDDWERNEDGH